MFYRSLLLLPLLAFAATLPISRAAEPPARQPNVLFIVSDDLATRLGCYGDPLARTPNLDRLAARGVRFERAYCQFPLCNPSRASFLTGLRPDTLRVYGNGTQFRQNVPDAQTLGQTFQKAGYYVARVGKLYHYGVPKDIGTDSLDDPPSWQERFNPRGRDRDEEQGIILLQPDGTASVAGPGPSNRFGATLSWLAQEGADAEQTDGKIAAEALRLMEQKKAEPFFLAVGFFRPHTPYVAPKKYFDLYPLEKIELPRVPDGHDASVPAPALATRKPGQQAMSDDLRRQAIQAYYAATSFMDAQVGQLLDGLDRLGLAEKTIVVFLSDHGYLLGEHGLWQKQSLFEESARVPLIIAAPGMKTAGRSSPRTVELLDLHPTLADLAGAAAPERLEGKCLRPLLENPQAAWDRPAYTQVLRKEAGRSVRTERWRYSEWGEAGAELYDHQADPRELRNLAADPQHADAIRELKALLHAPRAMPPDGGSAPPGTIQR
jgi:iduronate 2-sulfatase